MTDEIKPRIDEDGVSWCVQGCPFGDKEEAAPLSDKTEEELCLVTKWECVCPVHARRMAQWAARALRCLKHGEPPTSLTLGWRGELIRDYPGKQGAPCGTRRSEGGA